MLFVSKYSANHVGIQSEVVDIVTIDGALRPRIVKPELGAQFSQGCLMKPSERYAAVRMMREQWGGDAAFGAMPETHSGVIQDGTNRSYEASDPNWRVSGFRTDDPNQCPPDLRSLYEERLMTRECGLNIDYILVEHGGVEKPWPTYDKTHHNKIATMVAEMGLDPHDVLAYEIASKNRPGVVSSLESLVSAQADRALDDRPLEVTIP
jgi:hypothetical protein